VLWEVVVLLCDEHSFTKEILVNLLPVSLGDEPVIGLVTDRKEYSIFLRRYLHDGDFLE
jgi:hypothetical protein